MGIDFHIDRKTKLKSIMWDTTEDKCISLANHKAIVKNHLCERLLNLMQKTVAGFTVRNE